MPEISRKNENTDATEVRYDDRILGINKKVNSDGLTRIVRCFVAGNPAGNIRDIMEEKDGEEKILKYIYDSDG